MRDVLFTAILGDCDSLKPAPAGIQAVCFTNIRDFRYDIANQPYRGWDLHFVPNVEDNERRHAWHLRCVPHELFPDATRSIWIDASFTLTDLPRLLKDSDGHELSVLKHHARSSCYTEAREVIKVGQADAQDVHRQMDGYKREGFQPSALSISCIIVRQHTTKVQKFNQLWDREIKLNPGDNTQLSLDYCAWKYGIAVNFLQGGRKDNPYAVHDHADHKKRRKPYR